jgi:hypothetical protein
MPFKSQAQRRKFAQLLVEGRISNQTFEEWNRETGKKKLPERVRPAKARATKPARKRRARRQGDREVRAPPAAAIPGEPAKMKSRCGAGQATPRRGEASGAVVAVERTGSNPALQPKRKGRPLNSGPPFRFWLRGLATADTVASGA